MSKIKIIINKRYARYSRQRISKGSEGIGYKSMSGNHPNCGISKINQNTEKSPGDLTRLTFNQT